jgi:esterase/lipase
MRTNFLATLLALLCLVLGPAYAADKDVGIVLLHGKWDRQPTNVQGLARRLAAEGFQVTAPIMPWSANREYDVPYPQAISEIEAAAKGLRDKGVKRIVVGGLSFGANAALAYAGTGKPVDAIFLLSPGHTPYGGRMRAAVEPSVAKAKDMIKSGAAGDRASFGDLNQGQSKQVRASAESYLSYFDPEGLAAMPKSAAAIPGAIPIYMVVGSADPISSVAEETIFARAPKHERSVFTVVSADHIGITTVIPPALIAWLRSLAY